MNIFKIVDEMSSVETLEKRRKKLERSIATNESYLKVVTDIYAEYDTTGVKSIIEDYKNRIKNIDMLIKQKSR